MKEVLKSGVKVLVCINNHCYELIEERKEGFNEEAFKGRFSDILTKYDLEGSSMTKIRNPALIRKLVRWRNTYMNIAILVARILSLRK